MSITKSQTENIESIFNANRFIIPAYQRKYSWTDKERIALWKDIEESIKDGMNHFLGTLSFQETKSSGLSTDKLYEIIDGQQRITTLFILLKVLIDKLEDKEIRQGQLGVFIGSKNNLKLQPLGDDGEFLNKLLFEFANINKDEINKRSQKFMYSAVILFTAFTNALKSEEIKDMIIFIKDKIDVLVFNVEKEEQAVKMFSIINDRGLPLRILDKTKSVLMLYSTLHLNKQLNEQINKGFENIFDSYDDILLSEEKLKILDNFDENTIFAHHYYSSRKLFPTTWSNKDFAEKIFNNLKIMCDELKGNSEKLYEFITHYLEDLQNFAIHYSSMIKEIETKQSFQKPFRFLKFSLYLYPLIVRLYMQNKLDDLLPLLEKIDIRVYKLRGKRKLFADMYLLSSRISETDMTVDEIKVELIKFNDKFVNDHVFRTYLDSEMYENGAVKYILAEFNNDEIDINTYKDLQVEHIFSRDPNFDVSAFGFKEDYDYEKNRIGNLGLLESLLNEGLFNFPPKNKVSGYIKSKILNTRNLAGIIEKENYSKQNVDDRRKLIIDFSIDRFGMDKQHNKNT